MAITFDDGYADTLHQARPRLAAAGIPATLFLATAFVGQRGEYWWDELARGILERDDALDADVGIGDAVVRLSLDAADRDGPDAASWRAADPPRTARQSLFYALWQRLRALPALERDAAMDRLRAALRLPEPDAGDLPLTAAEVGELAADPLFEIGGHTATHPALPLLDAAGRRRDILDGKGACERLTGRTPIGFAFPYGANDADARAAVAECGFAWACTTQARPLAAREPDWFALPRSRWPIGTPPPSSRRWRRPGHEPQRRRARLDRDAVSERRPVPRRGRRQRAGPDLSALGADPRRRQVDRRQRGDRPGAGGGAPGWIRCLAHEGGANKGASASRNLATTVARGEFVAFLDADDVYLPDKLY